MEPNIILTYNARQPAKWLEQKNRQVKRQWGNGTVYKKHTHQQRATCLALLRTVRDLRLSVAARRPMSLPNCLRLCRRRLAPGEANDVAVLETLAEIYRQHQPFRRKAHLIRIQRSQ